MSNAFTRGDRYDSTRQAWEDIWDGASVEVELEAVQYARAQETINAYLPYLPENDIILEAGSGLSAVVIELRRKGYQATGLDYAVKGLQVALQSDPTQQLIAGDVHALPYADQSLGAYLSFGVLEHFEHGMNPALAEAYRVLKPGGVVVLTIPYPNLVYKLVQWKRKRSSISHLTDDEFYESVYNRNELSQAVMDAGFEVLTIQPTSHSFTLWGLGGVFREEGYYRTSKLAETMGNILKKVMPWKFNYMTLIVGRR